MVNAFTANLTQPIERALSRVTKKPFGLKVSPGHSPVSPEKFTGYHTGVDFETLPAEQARNVPVYAICSGQLVLKKWVSGYGGVAVERCLINKQTLTVIYGHLKLSSIKPVVSQKIAAGDQLGVLGKAYSNETDGERKHLHLGIHLGSAINIKGYVNSKSQLKNWLNPLNFAFR